MQRARKGNLVLAGMINLTEITPDNYADALQLAVKAEQVHLVAPVQRSLADAYVYKGAVFRLAYFNGALIGYVLLYPFAKDNQQLVNIVRLMIDQHHQGLGHGRSVLETVLKEIEHWSPKVDIVRISTLPENTVAINLYKSMGFVDSGIEDGELAFYRPTFNG